MFTETVFSLHALDRVVDRLHLSWETVKEIIDCGKAVMLGYEPGTRKVHMLFYSIIDTAYFVAVMDEKVREVVTILPVDYDFFRKSFYEEKRLKKIKLRARRKITGESVSNDQRKELAKDVSAKYFLAIYFRSLRHRNSRIILMSVAAMDYPDGKEQLEKDPAIQAMITRFADQNCRQGEYLDAVLFRRTKKAEPEPFAYER